jgi:cytochrome P450
MSDTAVEPFVHPLLAPLLEDPYNADPYPLYKRYRDEHPTHYLDPGFFVFTRYDDILAVLRDDRFSNDPRNNLAAKEVFGEPDPNALNPFDAMAGKVLLFTDPPDHTRMRNLVNKAFTRRTVEQLRPHVQDIVTGLIDDVIEKGEMDVIADFAYPLPALVICELMGVPVSDRDLFKGLSGDVAPILDPVTPPEKMQRALAALGQFVMYFAGLIEQRRTDPQDDLLSALIAAEEGGEHLTLEELFSLCVLVFIAGHETTQNLIGNGLLALLRHPDQLKQLETDPSGIRNAVEELLRYDSPVQLTVRSALEDIEVAGVTVKKGNEVIVLLGAGNRDPSRFEDPDRLDIAREKPQVVSFGAGVHFCMGAPLARLEAQIAFTELLARLPNIELAVDEPPWRKTLTLRGLDSLPVRF